MSDYDASIVDSVPNGWAVSIPLAQQGWRGPLREARFIIGGGPCGYHAAQSVQAQFA